MKKYIYELIIKTDVTNYNVIFRSSKKANEYKEYYKIGERFGNSIERITNTNVRKRILI